MTTMRSIRNLAIGVAGTAAAVGAVGTALALGITGTAVAASLAGRFRRKISLKGAVVLITGGSRGLGLALARECAAQGGRLSLVARDKAELERAAADLKRRGAEVFIVVADVRDRLQAENAVAETLSRYGSVNVLINNAGVIKVGPIDEMKLSDYEDALSIHVRAPLFLINAVIPHMRGAGWGRIVNIASIGGKIAVPHLGPYSASKFALVGLSDAFRSELAKDSILVTTVCPGLMRTGSHINAVFKGRQDKEFAWFSLGSASPLSSIAASRAARQIIRACRYGRPQLTITWQARLTVLASAVFPNLTAHALAAVNRTLPGPVHRPDDERPGWQCRSGFPPPMVTILPDRASSEYNEVGSGTVEKGD
jgi:NAD(P)-dependent dehydrogenase (short-subunit alcohol dehydrogenase family)